MGVRALLRHLTDTAAGLLDETPHPAALELLRRHGVAEPERAARELRALGGDAQARAVLVRLLPALVDALSRVPDPDAALRHLERFVRASGGGPGVLAALHERGTESLELLLWGLGGTPFLAGELVRHPEWAGWLADRHALSHTRRARQLKEEIAQGVADAGPGGARDVLRRTRRREIARLALRDLRRLASVEETLASLSALADALVEGALAVAAAETRVEAGLGTRAAGAVGGFVVLALGKLGGSELNFSSDVDLVYIHDRDEGAYAESLARRVTAVLAETSHEGHVYRVDLRLRPEGRAGAISHSVPAAQAYYLSRGAVWERLALIKARPVAGDRGLGRVLLRRVASFVWDRPFDAPALQRVLRMKGDSDRRLAAAGTGERHVKLGRGGIREIELITQVLQLRSHGRGVLRARATLDALHALRTAGLLSSAEADVLARAYVFLRDVENKLQMVHDSQTHLVPADASEQRLLARRLGYADEGMVTASTRFLNDLRGHTDAVHRLYEELLIRPLNGRGTVP